MFEEDFPLVFRVDLDLYRGPLDLLLYLVRKHEVDLLDIPIAKIAEQYLEYLPTLEQLDVNAVGDFLELASTLIEIKSQMVLPRSEEEDGEIEDPRQELVQRLLEYKKYRDAASMLEEQSRQWQTRYSRLASDIPLQRRELADQPIHHVELWDLVGAFGRLLREQELARPANIVYDETPIEVYMLRIKQHLRGEGGVTISDLFSAGMHKSALIGVFLAILELVRHRHVRAEQHKLHGEIWVMPGDEFSKSLDSTDVDHYQQSPPDVGNPSTRQ